MVTSVKLSKTLEKNKRLLEQQMKQMYREFFSRVSLKDPDFETKYNNKVKQLQMDPMDIIDQFVAEQSEEIKNVYFDVLYQYGCRVKDKVLSAIDMVSKSPSFLDLSSIENLHGISQIGAHDYPWFWIKTLDDVFSFLPIDEIYADDVKTIQFLHQRMEPGYSNLFSLTNGYNPFQLGNLSYACHFATEQFALLHPDFWAVTAICPHIYDGFYWFHSFNESKDGSYVVDVSNGMIMPSQDAINLLEPIILDRTLGEEIPLKKEQVLKDANLFVKDCMYDSTLKGFAFDSFEHFNLIEQERILKRIRN